MQYFASKSQRAPAADNSPARSCQRTEPRAVLSGAGAATLISLAPCPLSATPKEQAFELAARLLGAHEGFTNQKSMNVVDLHQLNIGTLQDATLGNHQAVFGDLRQQIQCGSQRHLKSMQVTVIDANQRSVQYSEYPLQFFGIVHLGQYIQILFAGCCRQFLQLGVIQTGRNQQDTVGVQRACLNNLVWVDHEVLADHRQFTSSPCFQQITVGTLEKIDIGQY